MAAVSFVHISVWLNSVPMSVARLVGAPCRRIDAWDGNSREPARILNSAWGDVGRRGVGLRPGGRLLDRRRGWAIAVGCVGQLVDGDRPVIVVVVVVGGVVRIGVQILECDVGAGHVDASDVEVVGDNKRGVEVGARRLIRAFGRHGDVTVGRVAVERECLIHRAVLAAKRRIGGVGGHIAAHGDFHGRLPVGGQDQVIARG